MHLYAYVEIYNIYTHIYAFSRFVTPQLLVFWVSGTAEYLGITELNMAICWKKPPLKILQRFNISIVRLTTRAQ